MLLVVGAGGYLGGEVCRQAVAAGEQVAGTVHRTPVRLPGVPSYPLDLRDRVAVRDLITRLRPDVVVNTAYRIDDWAVTADGAAHVALAAAEAGARLVHLSSDALHAGRPAPYGDDVAPTPVYPYGAAKAAAETAVRAIDPRAVLVRTSLIVGDERSKQVQLCLDALDGRARLFTDEFRCPIAVQDLAGAVLELAAADHAGVLNVAGPEAVSRAELGVLVARWRGIDPARLATSRAADQPQARPADVRLDSRRAVGLLTTRLRAVSEIFAA